MNLMCVTNTEGKVYVCDVSTDTQQNTIMRSNLSDCEFV